MPILNWRCACGAHYETLVVGDRFVGQLTEPSREETDACPYCDSVEREALVAGARVAAPNTAYPYYNRGLKATVTSPAHYKQLCQEQGKIPLEGADWNASVVNPNAVRIAAKERREAEMRERQRRRAESPEGRRVADLMANPRFMQDMLDRAGHTVQG